LKVVEHFDAGDLTVGIGAGTTVNELNAMLAPHRLMFAIDPPCPETATIGGVLATAAHGPHRHGFGAVRDHCIGIRFVTGDGRTGKGGGRVVKNVAGYDLMKLLIGSRGTLAVITGASFKLFPAPRQTRTFAAEFKTWQEALEFRDFVSKSPLAPICLELVSPGPRKLLRGDVVEDAWMLCLRAAGSDAVLARYRKELGLCVTREVEGSKEQHLWRVLADFPVPPGTESEKSLCLRAMTAYSLSIFVPPTDVGSVLRAAEEKSNPSVATFDVIGRVGLGHLLLSLRLIDRECVGSLVMDNLRCSLPPSARIINDWESAPSESMRAVKRALDPKHVLRGRFRF
jgi:glycolate oxidase FAD binding subunit